MSCECKCTYSFGHVRIRYVNVNVHAFFGHVRIRYVTAIPLIITAAVTSQPSHHSRPMCTSPAAITYTRTSIEPVVGQQVWMCRCAAWRIPNGTAWARGSRNSVHLSCMVCRSRHARHGRSCAGRGEATGRKPGCDLWRRAEGSTRYCQWHGGGGEGGTHIGAAGDADGKRTIGAAAAGVAEAAATEAVPEAAAVVEGVTAGEEARVSTHEVSVRADEGGCSSTAISQAALVASTPHLCLSRRVQHLSCFPCPAARLLAVARSALWTSVRAQADLPERKTDEG